MTVADVDDAFVHEVHDAVTGLGEGDTTVVDASVTVFHDGSDSEAWRVTLVLPAPVGPSWDIDRTIELKRQVRRVTDEIAARRRQERDGVTSVVLATNEARVEDIAEEDQPEPAERLDAVDEEPSRE